MEELSKQLELSKQILDSPEERYCEIYKIVNLENGKIYVGQAVSHILNHQRYRPYGMEGRFRCHVSEAFSKKKNQSHYLNNALRKYGVNSFAVELLQRCKPDDADSVETSYIQQLNSLFPAGYNLKLGGTQFHHSNESKRRVSDGMVTYFKDKKLQRFLAVKQLDEEVDQYIKPLRRNGVQYGWYVYIERNKADFGGVHIPLEKSKEDAVVFVQQLKNHLAKHLVAGSPLEP